MIKIKNKLVNQLIELIDDYILWVDSDNFSGDLNDKIKKANDLKNALKSKKGEKQCQDGHM